MKKLLAASFSVFVALTAVHADAPVRLIHETREAVLLDGSRIGTLHTTFQELPVSGRYRTTTDLELNFRCYGTAVRMRREFATEETSDGVVVGLSMKQLQDRGRQLLLDGKVEDGRLHVVVDNGRIERRIPWGDDVLGLMAQERLLTERRPKPGDHFSFRRYEPTFNTVVTVRVTVKEPEVPDGGGSKLLRVEMQPDRIEAAGTSVQPPGSIVWLDNAYLPVRREIELDGVGKVRLVRTDKEAPAPATEKTSDIGLRTLVSLDRRIPNPNATRSAIYRITLRGEPATSFVSDGHQEIRNVRGSTFELHVHPVRVSPVPTGGAVAEEYSGRNYFIDWEDPRIRDLAQRAAAGETDPWRKALRIEHRIFESMQPASGAALLPASQIAREMSGDCRAYAILTAAVCRAAGLPSRTAIGLIYTERGSAGPKLGFHMWTEVNIHGAWVGIDSTLGLGGVGACHLKISDHSWYGTRSLTPFLPANRVLGKLAVEVVQTEAGR